MNIEKSLRLHEKWIKGETGGKCADFKGVNLKNVSFKGANLEDTKINYKYANEFLEAFCDC